MWDDPRRLNFIAGLLTAFSIVMLATALVAWTSRLPRFQIRHVTIHGEMAHVDPARLRSVVTGTLVGTFFTMQLDEARRAFGEVPWVKAASVRRQWPDRLLVTIVEYRAFARWNDTQLVSPDGEVFDGGTTASLPLLYGGAGTAPEVVRRYREFSGRLATVGRAVAAARLSERSAWQLTLDNGLTVELGRDAIDERLDRLVTHYRSVIAPLVRDPQLAVDRIDLRHRNGFAVRAPGFIEPGQKPKPAPARKPTTAKQQT